MEKEFKLEYYHHAIPNKVTDPGTEQQKREAPRQGVPSE